MIFGIPDATLAAIVTLLSGIVGWAIKEWRDSKERERYPKSPIPARPIDEYDFAGRLKNEITRLQGLLDSAYRDLENIDTQMDLLHAENLRLLGESYEFKREILRLNYEANELSNQIDRQKGL